MKTLVLAVSFTTSVAVTSLAMAQSGSEGNTPPAIPAGDAAHPPAPSSHDAASPSPYVPPVTHHTAERQGVWRLVAPEDLDVSDNGQNRPRGWFRLDSDSHQTHFWVGGSFRIADGVAFAPFAHLRGSLAETDLAVSLQTGALWVMPAFGISFDFASTNAVDMVPQVFLSMDLKFVYVESWDQLFIGSSFHSGAPDTFYTRDILLWVASSVFAIGGQFEGTWLVNGGVGDSLVSAPLGGRLNLKIGQNDTIGLFLGYETKQRARGIAGNGDGIAGRFEYVHQL